MKETTSSLEARVSAGHLLGHLHRLWKVLPLLQPTPISEAENVSKHPKIEMRKSEE